MSDTVSVFGASDTFSVFQHTFQEELIIGTVGTL